MQLDESIATQNKPEDSNNNVESSQTKRTLDENNSEVNKRKK